MNNEFLQLDERVRKWMFMQGWSDLREIQKRAITPILSREKDVVISASTAAGKTEAFFLPACSSIAETKDGFGILYVSPLKALINDQFRRLEPLCCLLDLGITPWHGDISQTKKNKAREDPCGILLTTPESLESLLIRNPGWMRFAFSNIAYIAIDEFHAFIGTERGHHLLSLLNRLEHLLDRLFSPIPRVALSATLGDESKIPSALRPSQNLGCVIIGDDKKSFTVRIQVRGYREPETPEESATELVCHDLYKFCRGGSHLVFANSRQRTELISVFLRDLCERNTVPNEFFPHHSSLSKELREDLESRLQKEELPTTAVCTMTLELGIDIGKVNSVIQVTAPHSVSSLRQRLGRSGRRNAPAILRMLISERELNKESNIIDRLRIELVQSLAMIRLLIANNWFEPADTRLLHCSTLVHQILAVVAQWGGIRADQLFYLLCRSGPFQNVTSHYFKLLLSHLGSEELLTQISGGELTLGLAGERIVNHYSFYAVFHTPEEYRLLSGEETLGFIPVTSFILPGLHIIFGGRRWKVESLDSNKKIVHVTPTKGGKPPGFGGQGMSIHDAVRQEMFKVYAEGDYRISVAGRKVNFIDATAKELFEEAIDFFNESNLRNEPLYQYNSAVYIFTWLGDKVINTISTILLQRGFENSIYAGVIAVENTTKEDIRQCLLTALRTGIPDESELAQMVPKKVVQKYDEYLPPALLNREYGKYAFNSKLTEECLQKLFEIST